MTAKQPSIFREKALARYQQGQEQRIMLRVSCPSALTFLWIFLLILAGSLAFAWSVQVPIQFQRQGVVLEQGAGVVALVFLAPAERMALRSGQSATVSIGAGQFTLSGSVASVGTTLLSPDEARQRFDLVGGLGQLVTGPSLVATLTIGSVASPQVYAGSVCEVQIQVGSQSILSSLPGLGQFFRR
ncbi:MAG TPA: hypothetical protein VGF67_04935 [Ktedonobacteraceae bacterium]|jgi:hypothetical protein